MCVWGGGAFERVPVRKHMRVRVRSHAKSQRAQASRTRPRARTRRRAQVRGKKLHHFAAGYSKFLEMREERESIAAATAAANQVRNHNSGQRDGSRGRARGGRQPRACAGPGQCWHKREQGQPWTRAPPDVHPTAHPFAKSINCGRNLPPTTPPQAEIERLEAFVARFGAKASKASQAQSRQKMLDKLREAAPEMPAASSGAGPGDARKVRPALERGCFVGGWRVHGLCFEGQGGRSTHCRIGPPLYSARLPSNPPRPIFMSPR